MEVVMIFEATHYFYSLQPDLPRYKDEPCGGPSLNLVHSKKFLVESDNSTEAATKAFNHILNNPTEFSFQGMYLGFFKPADYFKKHLFKCPPQKPVADHHWVEVRSIAVIA